MPFCKYDLIPLLQNDLNSIKIEECENIPAFVGASDKADISLLRADSCKSKEFYEPLAAIAAGRFIYEKRGLPLTDVDVEISGCVYSVIIDEKNLKVGLKLRKSKQILSKQEVALDNVATFASDYLFENERIRLVRCDDSELFSDSSLRLLFMRDELPLCSVVTAYSCSKGKVKYKYLTRISNEPKWALGAALSIASELSAYYSDSGLVYFCEDNEFSVRLQDSYLSLYTGLSI